MVVSVAMAIFEAIAILVSLSWIWVNAYHYYPMVASSLGAVAGRLTGGPPVSGFGREHGIDAPAAIETTLSDAELPTIDVLLPAYREGAVIEHAISSIRETDYPQEKLSITVLVEPEDDETTSELERIQGGYAFDVLTVPESYPGDANKPRALNYGFEQTDNDVVSITDAEDIVHPQLYRAVAEKLADGNDYVQGRLDMVNENDGWMNVLFRAEYGYWYMVNTWAKYKRGYPIPLGGTTCFFPRDLLETMSERRLEKYGDPWDETDWEWVEEHDLEGYRSWDPQNVTEDFELGLFLWQEGYEAGYVKTTATDEESPLTLHAWVRQRTRWKKGKIYTFLQYVKHPPETVTEKFHIYTQSAVPHLGPINLLAIVAILLAANLFGYALHPITSIALIAGFLMAIAIVALYVYGYWKVSDQPLGTRLRRSAQVGLTLPMYWFMQWIADIRALKQTYSGELHWAKTTHFGRNAERQGRTVPTLGSGTPTPASDAATQDAGTQQTDRNVESAEGTTAGSAEGTTAGSAEGPTVEAVDGTTVETATASTAGSTEVAGAGSEEASSAGSVEAPATADVAHANGGTSTQEGLGGQVGATAGSDGHRRDQHAASGFSRPVRVLSLLSIVLFGVVLRAYRLADWSFYGDELYSVTSRAALPPMELLTVPLSLDSHPPFYYLLLHYWMELFGNSVASARGMSVVLSAGAMVVLYLLGTELFDARVGLLATLLFAVSTFQIHYGRIARMYSLFVLLALLSWYAFVRLRDSARFSAVGYVLATVLLIYTHVFGLFVVAAQFVYVALSERAAGVGWRRWLTLQAAVGLLAAPWIGKLLYHVYALLTGIREGGIISWVPKPTFGIITNTVLRHVGWPHHFPLHTEDWLFRAIAAVIVFVYAACIVLAAIHYRDGEFEFSNLPAVGELSTLYVVPIFVPFVISYLVVPVYFPRFTIPASIALFVLAAAGIVNIDSRYRRLAVILVVLVCSAALVGQYQATETAADWEGAAECINEGAQPGDNVLYQTFWTQNYVEYYQDTPEVEKHGVLSPDELDESKEYAANRTQVQGIADDADRIWLFQYQPSDENRLLATLQETHDVEVASDHGPMTVYLLERNAASSNTTTAGDREAAVPAAAYEAECGE